MSLWRKEAIERLPELQKLIATSDIDSPMMLWIELLASFEEQCEKQPLPVDLLRRIWSYAKWCLEQTHPDTANAAAVAFCEHLLGGQSLRAALPLIMSRADYDSIQALLQYHFSDSTILQTRKTFETTFPRGKRRASRLT